MSDRDLSKLAASALLALAISAPVAKADGFMAIHMDNQKSGSAVASFWADFAATGTRLPVAGGFMTIHMDNQKVGSEIWNLWQVIGDDEVRIADRSAL